MLGTGSALVTECYNTCFVLSDGDEHFLVDGGGGNGILSQLKKAGFNWQDMRTIFVTHKHVDRSVPHGPLKISSGKYSGALPCNVPWLMQIQAS